MMEPADNAAEKPPPYLPQPGDELPAKLDAQMDAIGPWATGRVKYTPEDGLTGVRPVADRCSITQFGAPQWRANNMRFFQQSNEKIEEAQCVNDPYRFMTNFAII